MSRAPEGGDPVDLPADLLCHIFAFLDGATVLSACCPVCSVWKSAANDAELWRLLISRRWEEHQALEPGSIDSVAVQLPEEAFYDLQDVYFRLAAMPSYLTSDARSLRLLDADGTSGSARPTVACFTGRELGGNQTVRSERPWPCTARGQMVAASTFSAFRGPPYGALRSPHRVPGAPAGALLAELLAAHYFEVRIDDVPADAPRGGSGAWYGRPCVAVGMCTRNFPLRGKMPGWDRHSFAYHGDDGCKFRHSNVGDRYAAPFGPGDVVGCGVTLLPGDPAVFFTLNGQLLPDPCFDLGNLAAVPLYPCVGIDTFAPVRVNFGAEPFLYDPRAQQACGGPAAPPACLPLAAVPGAVQALAQATDLAAAAADSGAAAAVAASGAAPAAAATEEAAAGSSAMAARASEGTSMAARASEGTLSPPQSFLQPTPRASLRQLWRPPPAVEEADADEGPAAHEAPSWHHADEQGEWMQMLLAHAHAHGIPGGADLPHADQIAAMLELIGGPVALPFFNAALNAEGLAGEEGAGALPLHGLGAGEESDGSEDGDSSAGDGVEDGDDSEESSGSEDGGGEEWHDGDESEACSTPADGLTDTDSEDGPVHLAPGGPPPDPFDFPAMGIGLPGGGVEPGGQHHAMVPEGAGVEERDET